MYPKSLQTKPSDLRPNPWNSNHVAPDNEAKLTASIRQRGIVRPILFARPTPASRSSAASTAGRWRRIWASLSSRC